MAKIKPVPVEVKVERREVLWEEAGLGREFEKLVEARQDADAAIKRHKVVKDETSAKILAVMAKKNLGKIVALGEFDVIRSRGTTASRLDAAKLLAAGVTPSQLEAGTVPGSSYDYVQVRRSSLAEAEEA